MSTYGRTVLQQGGYDIQVAADGRPVEKAVGITIDWSTVTAVSGADATYEDGTVVKIGEKGIPFGTILCKITTAEVQTATITGTPTGGTFTLSGNGRTTDPIAYNATAATVQAAIRTLGGDYADVVVTGSAGGPYTVTYLPEANNIDALTASGAGFTGGTAPGVTIATPTPGIAGGGSYGPYDSGATDGRQTLTRGRCCILNRTVLGQVVAGIALSANDHPQVITGGRLWRARLRLGGSGQPSVSNFEAAFPLAEYVDY